jgi:hypothetical protein
LRMISQMRRAARSLKVKGTSWATDASIMHNLLDLWAAIASRYLHNVSRHDE